MDEQISRLQRRVERIVPEAELRQKLEQSRKTGRPLRIKLGMDPTAPDVTLGHCVPLKVVRQFQEWGHKAVLIIGDYTARVGDPSGRNTTRPVLSGEQIDANAKTYVEQVGKILLTDPRHLEVQYNGQWLSKMDLVGIIRLLSQKTVAQMLAREDFHNRYKEGVDIRLHELIYPLMQGYDSVMIDADVEMGGSDQLFNNLVGRDLQAEAGKTAQVVMVTPLLVGTDGQIKMSKSKGNYIAVTDPPSGAEGMFGKIMSLPDSLLESYYRLLTDLPMDAVAVQIQQKPRDAKIALAKHVIAWLHTQQAADAAEADFIKQFVKHEVPDDIPEFAVGGESQKLAPLIVKAKLAATNSEAIRKIREGAVSLDGNKITDPQREHSISGPVVLRLGRRYARLKP
jgi:tyrosyl-tRNA synthetase